MSLPDLTIVDTVVDHSVSIAAEGWQGAGTCVRHNFRAAQVWNRHFRAAHGLVAGITLQPAGLQHLCDGRDLLKNREDKPQTSASPSESADVSTSKGAQAGSGGHGVSDSHATSASPSKIVDDSTNEGAQAGGGGHGVTNSHATSASPPESDTTIGVTDGKDVSTQEYKMVRDRNIAEADILAEQQQDILAEQQQIDENADAEGS